MGLAVPVAIFFAWLAFLIVRSARNQAWRAPLPRETSAEHSARIQLQEDMQARNERRRKEHRDGK